MSFLSGTRKDEETQHHTTPRNKQLHQLWMKLKQARWADIFYCNEAKLILLDCLKISPTDPAIYVSLECLLGLFNSPWMLLTVLFKFAMTLPSNKCMTSLPLFVFCWENLICNNSIFGKLRQRELALTKILIQSTLARLKIPLTVSNRQ